jgi:hypothetical protein
MERGMAERIRERGYDQIILVGRECGHMRPRP